MNITVLGCGRWGSFLAWYCARIGHNVALWGRPTSARMSQLIASRRNEYLTLPPSIALTVDLRSAIESADVIIISIGAQQLRNFLSDIRSLDVSDKKFILCMKGLESGTGKRLSTVFNEVLGARNKVAVWVGPGHVQDFVNGIPNCMVLSSDDEELTRALVDILKSPLIRFYYGRDLIGIEIGAAAKNVVGLAAGMLDGLNYSSLKGALMARGTHELSRLIEALGGDRMTVYGLSHLGDYEATLFSEHSNNRRFGEDFIRQKPFDKLAEGVETVKALINLSAVVGVELPICRTVDNIIHHNKNPRGELEMLFLRETKPE